MREAASPKPAPRKGGRELENWIFRDRESIEKRFGMKMEKVLELYHTDEGKKTLLEHMRKADPALNGNVHKTLDLVNKNINQLQKKESFLKKTLMLPVRATVGTGKFMLKHPTLTLLAVLATYGLVAYKGLPALWEYFTAAQERHAGNTLGKAWAYLESYLPFAHGTTGGASASLPQPQPWSL